MASISNISVGANFAGNYAIKARHDMNASIMRLSSGNRTMAGGDAAGASVGGTLLARAKSHYVGARNTEDAISALLTAESAMHEIGALATRLRELGVQADNAAFQSTADIAAQTAEATMIFDAITSIYTELKFNSVSLSTYTSAKTFAIGTGIDAAANNLTITTSIGMEESLSSFTTAVNADVTADLVLADVAESLGNIAAGISSLRGRQAVSYASASNLEAAAARILDTDYARETASLTKNSVLNQSAMAMVAQANQAQSAILSVLQ